MLIGGNSHFLLGRSGNSFFEARHLFLLISLWELKVRILDKYLEPKPLEQFGQFRVITNEYREARYSKCHYFLLLLIIVQHCTYLCVRQKY